MKQNKRKAVLAAALMLILALSLTACGGGSEIELTPYDVGDFTVGVPAGWVAVPTASDGGPESGIITVFKGTENQNEVIGKPSMVIAYYSEGRQIDLEAAKASLGATEEIDSGLLEGLAGFEWTGFKCSGAVYEYEMLIGSAAGEEKICLEVTVQASDGMGGPALSVEDADVRAIIGSIVPDA